MGQEKHLMVDIESLSTSMNGLITTVGCVLFNIETGHVLKSAEYTLNWSDQRGRDVNKDTLRWWFSQSQEAQNAMTSREDEMLIGQFYVAFKEEFCQNITKAWAKSPGFDYGMLNNLFEQNGFPSPIPFRKIADCRDMYFLAKKFKIKLPENDLTAHCALDDALKQTEDTCLIFKTLADALKNDMENRDK